MNNLTIENKNGENIIYNYNLDQLYMKTIATQKFQAFDMSEWPSHGVVAFTMNPKNQYMSCIHPGNRWNNVYKDIQNLLSQHSILQYHLWMEISKAGRFHVHGYLKVSTGDLVGLYSNVLPHLAKHCTYALVHLNPNTTGSWMKYSTKQLKIMETFSQELNNLKQKLVFPIELKTVISTYLDPPTEKFEEDLRSTLIASREIVEVDDGIYAYNWDVEDTSSTGDERSEEPPADS